MKNLLFFLLLSLVVFSCKKDDNLTADLIKDGGLNDAPFILAGEYILATRFTSDELNNFQGRNLEGIEYYLRNKPNQCEVRVYSGSNGNEPGTLVYAENVTVEMDSESWNLHTLTEDIAITGEDLWIGLRIVLNTENATVGCDSGPAVPNGDWIVSLDDNDWISYREFTNQTVSINWNIRGHVSNQ